MCIGDGLVVTCTVLTVGIFWEVNGEMEGFTIISTVHSVKMVGNFEILLVSVSPDLVSTATLTNINSNHNGTVLTCLNSQEETSNLTIIVQGRLVHVLLHILTNSWTFCLDENMCIYLL